MLSKKEMYQHAFRKLEKKRLQQYQIYTQHLDKVYQLEPECKVLKDQLAKTGLKIAKITLSANPKNVKKEIEKLRKENQMIQDQLHTLLKQLSFPEDYLEQKPDCPLCNDSGFTQPGKPCSCFKKLLAQAVTEDLQQNSPLKLTSFDNFSLEYYSKSAEPQMNISPYQRMRQILDFCKKYAAHFPYYPANENQRSGILMLGKTGLGKTHLSLAIAAQLVQRGFLIIYITASELARLLSSEQFNKIALSKPHTMEAMMEADLIILDDLGAEFKTSFSSATIYDLISARISKGMPTIVNTNLSIEKLQDEYAERLVSRIYNQFVILEFLGNDIRMLKAPIPTSPF